MTSKFLGIALMALTVIVSACAPATGGGAAVGGDATRTTPKRVVAAIMADPPVMARVLNPGSHWRGIEHIQALLAGGLTGSGAGNRYPELAEAVPSPDNGLWKINPDGTMETTWHIKNGMQWHDGTPFTSADLFFTMQVCMDKEVPLFSADGIFTHISGYEAPDARTMVVRWKDPFIDADSLFGSSVNSPGDEATPMAKHIMERSYPSNKSGFGDDPYWGVEYVGTGPFVLKSWQPGSGLVLTANDHYVFGRPKLDEVEFRFIEDAGTLQANLLANTVDMTLGRNLSGPQSQGVSNQWPDGQLFVDYTGGSIQDMFVQQRNPDPPVLTDVTFRKAALMSLDRQSMVDSLMAGQSKVADSFILPDQEPYRDVQAKYTVKYPYDPRQSLELLQSIGYA
ncbi:MAG TPA: ABC transporter substrate-binding protein, partial [Chloroflexota bacterium]